jgi:putative Holliday junction resolvase
MRANRAIEATVALSNDIDYDFLLAEDVKTAGIQPKKRTRKVSSAMPLCKPSDLPELLPAGLRLLGLDLGSKTIGLAITDAGLRLASPISVINRRKFTQDMIELERIIREREVGGIVLGLPLNMDGSEGPRTQATRDFAAEFLNRQDLPLTFWDERLSTAAVERAMIQADMSRKRRAAKIDQAAAAYILQGMLDALPRQSLAP